MVKRTFDIIASSIGLILLSPLFMLISIAIKLESKGGIFYLQKRVGLNGREFDLIKFRSMYENSDKKGLLTIGNDNRITKVGKFIRKYKLDELPQLINVLKGEMSIVGPRPEVKKYVELYTNEQKKVLTVKPGITEYASIEYRNENELLAKSQYPEKTYIEEIMPKKLQLNLQYIERKGIITDLKIILLTLEKIFIKPDKSVSN